MSSSILSVAEAKKQAEAKFKNKPISKTEQINTRLKDLSKKTDDELMELVLELEEIVGEEETPRMKLIKRINFLENKLKQ